VTEKPEKESSSEATAGRIERAVALLVRRAESVRLAQPEPEQLLRSAYLLLAQLDERGPLGVAALAAGTRHDVSTVSRQILPLEREGLVRRLSHPEDARISMIEITPSGRERLVETRLRRRNVYLAILRDWSETDRELLAEYLERLNDASERYIAAESEAV